jgi:hypothetical protein
VRRWCIFEVRAAGEILWAWCLSDPTQVGFDTVAFTYSDGMTLADMPDEYRLGQLLFSIPARLKEES